MEQPPHTDDRLESYRTAVRAMREGQFVPIPMEGAQRDAIAGLGLELVLLARWLEERFAEFRKLQAVANEIGSGLYTDDILDGVFVTFSALIPYDRMGCALLGNDGQTVRAYWAKATYPDLQIKRGFTASMAGSSLETILASGRPRILNDLEEYLAAHPKSVATQLIVAEGVRSSLTCPLIANGKPLGFLFFSSRARNTYQDAHPAIFQQIAGQVSILIEKSQLYQQIFELNQQLIEAHQNL